MNKKRYKPNSNSETPPVNDVPLTESEYIKIKEGMREFRKTFKF